MLSSFFKKASATGSRSRGRTISFWGNVNKGLELGEDELFSHFQSLAPSLSDMDQRKRYLAYLAAHPPSKLKLEDWIRELRTATETEPVKPVKAKRARSKTPVRRSRSASRPKGDATANAPPAIVSGGSCACGRR